MASKACPNPCHHCGQPAPQGKEFCCPGCAAAWEIIHKSGLDKYYRARSLKNLIAAPVPAPPPTVDFSPFITRKSDQEHTLELLVEGLHCAACAWLIEQTLTEDEAVDHARLNLSTHRLRLSWNPRKSEAAPLVAKIWKLGYRAIPFHPELAKNTAAAAEKELLLALGLSGFAAGNVMLLSIGVWAGGDMGEATRSLLHWVSALIALPVLAWAGRPFYRSAGRALLAGHMNMDVPISLAVIVTATFSLHQAATGSPHVYFESVLMLLFFLLVGRFLDTRVRARAGLSTQNLLLGQQGTAVRLTRRGSETVMANALKPGDRILVARGEKIPADGLVMEGASALDTAILTGESLPRPVTVGEPALAGCLNLEAPLTLKVTATGEEATLARIARLVEDASQVKNRYTRLADRAARLYAPAVHLLAATAFVFWLAYGAGAEQALIIAVAVLIVTCPCALALAVPAAQVASTGALMRRGILLRDGAGLEKLATVDTVIFDKTGTLTLPEPQLITPMEEVPAAALSLALSSRHPLARALCRAAADIKTPPATRVEELPGKGLKGRFGLTTHKLGSRAFCGEADAPAAPASAQELWYRKGRGKPRRFLFAAPLRPDTAEVVAYLNKMGLELHLLSGDREETTAATAGKLGILHWQSQCLPEQKQALLARLQEEGHRVLMVGDGINDAPSLALADVSMAPATAADVALVKADFIFQGEALAPVPLAHTQARRTQRVVRENLALALVYNALAVPLAMAGFITPLWAAVLMSASSICVTLNSMRLSKTKTHP